MAKWVDRNRRCRARAGDRFARVLHRDQWPPGSGGDRAAGGHAERARSSPTTRRPLSRSRPRRAPPTWRKLGELLAEAQRPLAIVGGSRWSPAAREAMQRFAERFALPVATSYRRLPLFDPLHPCYAGDLGIGPNPKLVARIKNADLVLLVGGRLGELASQGYTPVRHSRPANQAGACPSRRRGTRAALSARIWRSMRARRRSRKQPRACSRPARFAWRERTQAAHADYLAWTDTATEQPGGVNLGAIMVWLRENLPDDTILCNGAGNYAAWIHRFYRFRRFATHIAPTSASMGYGMPSAVAMKRLYPERTVISVNGDGDFLMNGQEFATAVQYELPIVVIVCDNGIYGTIRMHQEREYPGRVFAHRRCAIRILRPMPAPSAASASRWRRRRILRRRSGQRQPPESRRSSMSRSILKRSRR